MTVAGCLNAGELAWASGCLQALDAAIGGVIVGMARPRRELIASLLAGGHVLLEGVPGVAKTALAKTIARSLDLEFTRIQFTPDLLPGDLTGTVIYDPSEKRFIRQRGPIFTQVLLADEINRAPAKVQSALLEAMEEHQVTMGGDSLALPKPFWVLATQNPVELEGTFPLPEAQQDRFMARVSVSYPGLEEEREIAEKVAVNLIRPSATPVLGNDDLTRLQGCAARVHCSKPVRNYAVDLARATRKGQPGTIAAVAESLRMGAGPRGPLALLAFSRGLALLNRRDHVRPEDIQDAAWAVLGHRLVLDYAALARGQSAENLVERLLDLVPAP